MKNILKSIGEWVIGIIGAVVFCIFVSFRAFLTPLYYIKYKCSAYYKASKKPYEFFMNFDFLKLYNQLVIKGNSYEYHKNGDYEYFTKDADVLFYCDIYAQAISFVYKDDGWFVEDFSEDYNERGVVHSHEEGDVSIYPLLEFATEMLKAVKDEHKNLNPKLIVSHEAFNDDEIEKAKECPYFYF